MIGNPFFYESPTDRWSFTDRDELIPALTQFMRSRGRRLLVHGRRRMGKTSLIRNTAMKAKAPLVYVDISKAASLADVAQKLLEAAPPQEKNILLKAIDLAKKHLKGFTVTALNKIALSGDFRSDNPRETLEKVLVYLNERVEIEEVSWTVCLDEFQDLRLVGGERPEWLIRGIIQDHRHLNYIFSGSDHSLVSWMTDSESAFFKQLQQMEVGPIDPVHLAKWIDGRSKHGGLLDSSFGTEVIAFAGPCTGDVVRLAKVTFDLFANGRKEGVVATAMDAISLVELNSEFVARWAELSVPQRSLLQAVTAKKPLTAAATVREYGLKSASTAQSASKRLHERQILIRLPDGLDFENPFFKRWVCFNAG
jgi:hypothetical protein